MKIVNGEQDRIPMTGRIFEQIDASLDRENRSMSRNHRIT